MPYIKKARPLSGVQSQPPGGRISAYALSGFDKHLVRTEKGPAWYGQMQGATLGSDEELTEAEFRLRSVAASEAIRDRIDLALKHQELIKWLQLAATLSIPLAAAVWKAILGKRRSKMSV
jgi:hypothetical protein